MLKKYVWILTFINWYIQIKLWFGKHFQDFNLQVSKYLHNIFLIIMYNIYLSSELEE